MQMAENGYAGKILRVNLTTGKIGSIPTRKYEAWVGGHGMGSAIFFDLVKDKTIDGFDPANVVTMMTSPLTGTLVPAGAGRTEVQGIGVQSYPIGWFTRSNFGGRFSANLKYAGWDGIVIEGGAEKPVWIDIRDEKVAIRDCGPLSLWGMDTWKCQQTIWEHVAGDQPYGEWIDPDGQEWGQTTQRSAVVAIGPAGENLCYTACLIHDASNGSGQGGFGAVWGSKRLKAISAIGTGSVPIHDPKALLEARLWQKKRYAFDRDDLKTTELTLDFQSPPVPGAFWGPPATELSPGDRLEKRPTEGQRPQACVGCHSGCRARYATGAGNEATCYETLIYMDADSVETQRRASDLVNKYGLNAYEVMYTVIYVRSLHERGFLGPGKIDCPLDFSQFGSLEFIDQLMRIMAYGDDGRGQASQFGEALTKGLARAAKAWGRLDEDLRTGDLPCAHWGIGVHRDPRVQLEWGYGTILGDRDINEHDFDQLHWVPTFADWYGRAPEVMAEEAARIYTDKMVPFHRDPDKERMLDFSDENMYSEQIAKLVSWHRYYTRFWKQSALFCDWRWPDFVNLHAPGKIGSTGEAEPKFFNAVTGKEFSFLDGIELGRKIWNLDHAIWTLQGRHRGMVRFAPYVYTVPAPLDFGFKHFLPGRKDGKWGYFNYLGRHLDEDKFEEFKTRFYGLQGWEETTGYPTRETLQELGLGYVADELERHGRLGGKQA